ncbi:J domain-containing protein [Allosphingosinicella sp.]|uniref:J domain-containing protein n=1 Tax=Allosphingosinicella sp. TaxID=2823234 RepID=UPI002FC1CFAB
MSLDPYSALGIEPNAPLGDIRRAYRRQAKKLHPDANPSSDSTREFQRLNEAYRVLRNPHLRLAYDASKVGVMQTFTTFPEFGSRPNASPLRCQFCRKPTVRPRFTIYWSVVSNLVYASRHPKSGMFCTPCARQASLRATLISACFGWWSLPGLILTPMAIVRNARGGVRPPGGDTLLLWNSALRFYTRGDARIAKGLAKELAASPTPDSIFGKNMLKYLNYLRPQERGAVEDGWRAQRSDRWKHLLLALAVPGAVAFAVAETRVGETALPILQTASALAYQIAASAWN